MSRKLKNIIMGLLAVILVCSICFTVCLAKKSNSINSKAEVQNSETTQPLMPNGEMSDNSNAEQPPEKPDSTN